MMSDPTKESRKGLRAATSVTFSRDAVLDVRQLAAGLQVSVRVAEKMDLPTVYIGPRLKRFIWGQVLDVLAERAA